MGQPEKQIKPYSLKPGEGWTYRFFGVDFCLKAREASSGSGAGVLEYVTRKGEEPGEHTHRTEDEMFYVLEGSITFQCGSETFELEKGGFIFLPHGIPHGYTINSDDPVRLLIITAPIREYPTDGWGGFISDIELRQGELMAKPDQDSKG